MVRWKGFLPIGILVTGLGIYFTFFLDWHLKYLIEKGGSAAHGAHIDVGTLRTSLWKSTFNLTKLEVAHRTEALKNIVEIDQIQFEFRFGALLKKKFVIDLMAIDGIHYGTKRTYSGLIPPKPPEGPSFASRMWEKVSATVSSRVEQSSLAQYGTVLSSTNLADQLNQFGKSTHALARLNELQADIQKLESNVKSLLQTLPNAMKSKEIEGRVQTLVKGPFNHPNDYLNAAKEAENIKREVEGEIQKIQRAQSDVTGQVDGTTKGLATLEQSIQKDISAISEKLKLPELNLKDITAELLGPKVIRHYQDAVYYVDLARRYMPKGKKEKIPTVVRKRQKGTDVHFGKKEAYPAFWLKEARISSEVSEDTTQGKLSGSLVDLTSDPPFLGRPTVFRLDGDFPKSNIFGAQIRFLIDHTTETAKEFFHIKIKKFPIVDFTLSKSPDLNFAIPKANGDTELRLEFVEDDFLASFVSLFTGVQYRLEAKEKKLESILSRVLASLPSFNARMKLESKAAQTTFTASSDLGQKLIEGIRREIEGEVKRIEAAIRKKINDEIKGQQAKLMAQFQKIKDDTLGEFGRNIKSFQDLQSMIDREVKKLETTQRSQVEGQVNKELEKVKKSIKLPF